MKVEFNSGGIMLQRITRQKTRQMQSKLCAPPQVGTHSNRQEKHRRQKYVMHANRVWIFKAEHNEMKEFAEHYVCNGGICPGSSSAPVLLLLTVIIIQSQPQTIRPRQDRSEMAEVICLKCTGRPLCLITFSV